MNEATAEYYASLVESLVESDQQDYGGRRENLRDRYDRGRKTFWESAQKAFGDADTVARRTVQLATLGLGLLYLAFCLVGLSRIS